MPTDDKINPEKGGGGSAAETPEQSPVNPPVTDDSAAAETDLNRERARTRNQEKLPANGRSDRPREEEAPLITPEEEEAKPPEETEPAEEGRPTVGGIKGGINRLAAPAVSFIHRRKIRAFDAAIKQKTKDVSNIKRDLSAENAKLRALKIKLLLTLGTEMFIDMGIAFSIGLGELATVVGILIAIFYHWSIKMIYIFIKYMIFRSGRALSKQIKKEIRAQEEKIKAVEKNRKLVERDIQQTYQERFQVTQFFQAQAGETPEAEEELVA